jgi:hypothetical protein
VGLVTIELTTSALSGRSGVSDQVPFDANLFPFVLDVSSDRTGTPSFPVLTRPHLKNGDGC